MTDEATPTGGAESAPEPAAAPTEERRPLTDVERLKAMIGGQRDPAKAEPSLKPTEAPVEGKPAVAEGTDPDAAPEVASEDADAPAEDKPASQPPDLAAVAKMLGVSPSELVIDEDGTLAFKTKVDGIEGRAKPTDLRKSFQLEAAHTRRLMELSEREKTFRAEAEQRAAAIQARAQQTDQYLELARQELLGELGRTDWAALQATDPVEYSAKYIHFQQRVAAINQALSQRQAEEQKAAQAARSAEQERLAREFKELLNHVPSWADDGVRKQGQKEVADFLKSTYQFNDADVAAVAASNHKALRIVLDAHAWHKHQAEAKAKKAEVLKKVEAAPKMAKPGTPAAGTNQRTELQKARVAFRKSGGKNDVGASVLKAMGLVGRNK